MTRLFGWALGAAVLVASFDASAFTMRESAYIKGQMRYFKGGYQKTFQRYCKTKIPTRINWRSFHSQIRLNFARKIFKSPYSYCNAPFGTLYGMCQEGAQSAIKRQIRSYTCHFGGRGGTKVRLTNGHLEFWVDWKKTNVHKFLRKRLGDLLSASPAGGRARGVTARSPHGRGFTVRESLFIKKEMRYYKRGSIRSFRRYCKMNIPTPIDWRSFRSQIRLVFARKLHRAPYSYCQKTFDTLRYYCRKGYSARIRRKVKRYVCKFGGRGRSRVTLRRGTLTFYVDWYKGNIGKYLTRRIGDLL